jgi:CSLREA domain-containing protein
MRSRPLVSVVAVAIGSLLFVTAASANTITVTSTADPVGTAGTCTLRNAIVAANTNTPVVNCAAGNSTSSNPDTIDFSLPGSSPWTIQLDSALPALDDVLTIDGPVAGSLTVRGELGTENYRVFDIEEAGSAPFPNVTLRRMTITNGAGGINVGAATAFALDHVIVSGNSVASTDAAQSSAAGAGIASSAGTTMNISNSTVSGNSATATTTGAGTCCSVFALALGAGVYLGQGGPLNIDRSTISGNTASANGNQTSQAIGGGIFNDFGPTTITRSTISGNTAAATVTELGGDGSANAEGGGIHQQGGDLGLSLDGDTVSGNTASTVTGSPGGNGFTSGGGIDLIWTATGGLTGQVTGSTIAGNTVSETGPGGASLQGANVNMSVADLPGAEFTFQNSIIANQSPVGSCADEGDGAFGSLGYNIDTSGTGCLGTPVASDQTTVSPASLNLGPLQDNGGATETMAPGINSPAVDKGIAAGDPVDQRLLPRTFDMNPGSATGGDGTDIGAFEQTILSGPDPSHDFGSRMWGTSTTSSVYLLNRTGNSLTPGTLAFSGTNAGDFGLSSDTCSNAALANNFSCTVDADFHPVSAGNGARGPTTLSFPTNVAPAASVDSIDFTGDVTEYISLVPSPKDYGSTQVGTPTAATQFTVENAGPSTSGNLAVALTGANASEFEITGGTCDGVTLPDDGTCTVSVRFAPTSAGAKSATLAVTGTPGGTQSSALTGTATAVPTPPTPTPPAATPGPTGQRAAALKKCKKKKTAQARKKCKKNANKLPV